MSRDHGGNLDHARRRFGGVEGDWIDLSTGINRVPYPLPAPDPGRLRNLPTAVEISRAETAAQRAYATDSACVALAGAQAGIQFAPRLRGGRSARILGPTYNEHAASFAREGWQVDTVTSIDDLRGADAAVVVNPNNPDGRQTAPAGLRDLATRVGLLIVDESFCDPLPDLSCSNIAAGAGMVVLRSFGKFYGLAGLRLGFALGPDGLIDQMRELAGPWPVSGPALAAAEIALTDTGWRDDTILRLEADAARLDGIVGKAGWKVAGGTTLFRLYRTPDAAAAQTHLAERQIWSRIFPWSDTLVRLGLPGGEPEWTRVVDAFR